MSYFPEYKEINYKFWQFKDLWTDQESVLLLCGLEPRNYEKSEGQIYHDTHDTLLVDDFIKAAVNGKKLKEDSRGYKYRVYSFYPQTIIKWAIEKNLSDILEKPIPVQFVEWYEAQQKPTQRSEPNTQNQANELEHLRLENESLKQQLAEHPYITSHRSELLDIMQEAITDLWENHDPETPPTIAMLDAWFNQKGYARTKNEITAIDKIMRPDRYKGGKNNK